MANNVADADGKPAIKNFAGWNDADILAYVLQWFHYLYTDPADEMPWVDGEYLYIWGGPYEPSEVIHEAFDGLVSKEIIDEAIEAITADGTFYWAPSSNHNDQLEAAREHANRHEEWLSENDLEDVYLEAKAELEAFIKQHVKDKGTSFMHRMAFMQAWAILEAYLSGKIVKAAREDPTVIERLFRNHPTLSKQTFKGEELLKTPDLPRRTAITYLERETYHALQRVLPLYEVAFGHFGGAKVDFGPAMTELGSLVRKRHDCVHRNGKTTDNEDVEITSADIASVLSGGFALASEIEKLVKHYAPSDEIEF